MTTTGGTGLTETTYAELKQIAARYPQARSGLLPMLHLVQAAEGCVTAEGIEVCAEILGISAAEVAGVATFYTMYKRRPVGDYHVGVCTNTLCAVMGGDLIFERLKDHLDVGNDETTEDGKITLEHVECNAACDYAPVMMVNWEFMDNQTPESAVQVVDDLAGTTLAYASSMESDVRTAGGDKTTHAKKVGELVASRAKAAGIEGVVFDRAGNKYHGRIAALADAAREGGLSF